MAQKVLPCHTWMGGWMDDWMEKLSSTVVQVGFLVLGQIITVTAPNINDELL